MDYELMTFEQRDERDEAVRAAALALLMDGEAWL